MDGSLASMMAEKLGGGKPAKKAKLHMHIKKMEDGKYLTEHHMVGGEHHTEPTQYAHNNIKELMSHISSHYNEPMPSQGEVSSQGAADSQPSPQMT
jgi:hypothetical protein